MSDLAAGSAFLHQQQQHQPSSTSGGEGMMPYSTVGGGGGGDSSGGGNGDGGGFPSAGQDDWQQQQQQQQYGLEGGGMMSPRSNQAGLQGGWQQIKIVQSLIERCLQQYLSQAETMAVLQSSANVEPSLTSLVWGKLEEQNPDFFFSYQVLLRLRDQIQNFNQLVDQQVQLMAKLTFGSPPPLMPNPIAPPAAAVPMTTNNEMMMMTTTEAPPPPAAAAAAATDMRSIVGSCNLMGHQEI